jgi:hypothetical protein
MGKARQSVLMAVSNFSLLARHSDRTALVGPSEPPDVLIRRASGADAAALETLARLDSRPAPVGDFLVAEVDGELVAAVPLDGGEPFANPFRFTAELVGLLVLRAAHVRDGRGPRPDATARRALLPRSRQQATLPG